MFRAAKSPKLRAMRNDAFGDHPANSREPFEFRGAGDVYVYSGSGCGYWFLNSLFDVRLSCRRSVTRKRYAGSVVEGGGDQQGNRKDAAARRKETCWREILFHVCK